MKASAYTPRRFRLIGQVVNRLSHRIAALTRPEATLRTQPINLPREVKIVDTAFYEGLMDVNTFLASDAKGIVPKASQAEFTDSQFLNTWRNFKGRVPRGCYHFYDPRHRPSLQVEQFVSLIRDDPPELPMVVDWEASDSWGGDYRGWPNLYDFLEGLKMHMPGRGIMIYTGYYYWLDHSPNPLTQASSLAYFGQYDLWLAWYTADFSIIRIPKPWTALKWLQYTDSGNGRTYGAQSNSIDLSYYAGSMQNFIDEYKLAPTPPPPPPPKAFIVKRKRTEVSIEFTDGTGALPLMNAVDHAAAHGWMAAMNGGAGFDYTDADHAIPRVEGFAQFHGIPYARWLISAGVNNTALLDNPNVGPWSILAFDSESVYLIVTEGLEGVSGLTQWQAANFCHDLGITEAYLMDSGHSSQIEEGGQMLYWPYGPSERVPQAIGLSTIQTGGTMTTKGVCKAGLVANVKRMDGVLTPTGSSTWAQMKSGDQVYGDLSATGTDITNFTHFTRADGTRFELPAPCKVSVTNLDIFPNTPEPGTVPPPPTVPTVLIPSITLTLADGSVYQATSVTLSKLP